jgi:DnaJ-class molecular chaperone
MGQMRDSLKAALLGKCQACHGSGQRARYIQAAEVTKNGKLVTVTDMTAYGTCTTCGGSGNAR